MKKPSHLSSKEFVELLAEKERLEKEVEHHNINGWFNTVYHDELAKVSAVLKSADAPDETEKDLLVTGKGSAIKLVEEKSKHGTQDKQG